jgi:hypothetical protein
VRWRRETVFHNLIGAYRDPYTAKLQLDEMVKRQGLTSTAARIAQDPRQLGELRQYGAVCQRQSQARAHHGGRDGQRHRA